MPRHGILFRLSIGYGAVLALLVLLSINAYFATQRLGDSIDDVSRLARSSHEADAELQRLSDARLAILAYRTSPSDAAGAEARARLDAALAGLERLEPLARADAAMAPHLDEVRSAATAYDGAFEGLVAATRDRVAASTVLGERGVDARRRIDALVAALREEGRIDEALRVADANVTTMRARGRFDAYLQGADETIHTEGVAMLDEARAILAPFVAAPSSARTRAAEADEGAKLLRDAAESAHAAEVARRDIARGRLDIEGPRMQAALTAISDMAGARRHELSAAARTMAHTTETTILIGALVIVALGAALAIFSGRAIGASVRRMAELMSRIADGDLDVAVEGAERKHELGQMARALESFRAAGLRERASNAESRRRAEAMAALQAEVRASVEAGVAGDFSRRIERRFDEAEFEALARALDDLMASVGAGVAEACRVMARVADGDLSQRMTGDFQGAVGRLRDDVNATTDRLGALVSDIAEAASEIRASAAEIASGAEQVSSRAEQQAAALEETSASMEEMSGSVRSAADNASRASDAAQQTVKRARDGEVVADAAEKAVAEIERSAKRIAEIVSVSDSIAFTTNLLALNASVEAARAGEAGKGFAVVASEVRLLAQRSADAAREIRELIEDSMAHVETGVGRVVETREALGRIVAGVREVGDEIAEISRAGKEQAASVAEVAGAVTQMDQITQSNAALAEESASSAAGLAEQAARLETLTRAFRGARRASDAARAAA